MTRPYRRALCWLRRDLRLTDHAPLAAATELADEVAVAFVFDRRILDRLADRDDRRVTFIHRSLQEIDTKLRSRGSALVVRIGDPAEEIPRLAQEMGADAVFAGRDYEPYAVGRDRAVAAALAEVGAKLETRKDSVVFEGGEVLTQDGRPYRVYSPYARAWRAKLDLLRDARRHEPDLDRLMPVADPTSWSLAEVSFAEASLWLDAGEEAGRARLRAFGRAVDAYGDRRNFPAEDGTSGLSAHFRFGTVSIRAAVRAAVEKGSEGADKWLSEIIWRDFYQDVLANFPRVVEHPFQERYEGLAYPGDPAHFDAWCRGETGYPIVDAAMRCLNKTGWMHNRLRMIVASFLTKDLLIDYRSGEAYFARRLLDFDLASNNGGWQWAAGVGCDAQPYFRVFNPVLQSERFDPEGRFIREWCPELAGLDDRSLHFPARAGGLRLLEGGVELGRNYPHPIVQHEIQKDRAIALLRDSAPGQA